MQDSRFTAYVYGAIYTVERKCEGFNGFGISYTPLDGRAYTLKAYKLYAATFVDEFSHRLRGTALAVKSIQSEFNSVYSS